MKTKLLIATLFIGMTTLYAQNIPSYVPKNGLVGYWPFNGNANDESGNGNNGTVNGASLTLDRNGVANSAYSFDGINNDISISKLNNMQYKPISYSVWFNPDSLNVVTYSKGGGIVLVGRDHCGYYDQGSVMIWDYASAGANNNIAYYRGQDVSKTYYTPLINKWQNIIASIDENDTIKFYLNGTLISKQYYVIAQNGANIPFKFGAGTCESTTPNRFVFNGQLDDIAIYNRALTEQEITSLYYSGVPAFASTNVFVDAPASVNENENVEVSISTEALNTTDNVIAFQTDFSYDTTRYTFVTKNLTGTLNPSANVAVNSTENGKLNISYMTQTALNGAGSLVKLTFKANKTLGKGIFSLSNFLYNTTAVTRLKSDTVNTLDVTPPSARIHYSQNPVRKGDSLLITVKYSENMAVTPIPQFSLSGQNTLANSNLTKVNDTTYTYWWVVEKGNGAVQVTLATGKDLAGNNVIATPTQNASFTVLPTLFGDIDTNKLVQAYDAALALQYSVGLNPLPTMDALPWSNWRIVVANVDTVGNVTANDASLILQHSAKLITTFPADAKKRVDSPIANITVTQEANQLVFRATGTLYAFNVFMKDNFNAFGQPEVKDKNAMVATNISPTTYNVGLASTTPFAENEPFLVIPIITNENVQGTMDIVANTQEKALAYGTAASIAINQNDALVVYPNPTKDVITIHNAQGKTVKIVDVQGKEVYNAVLPTAKTEISLKAFGKAGVYVLHVVDANNESVQTKQIVLE